MAASASSVDVWMVQRRAFSVVNVWMRMKTLTMIAAAIGMVLFTSEVKTLGEHLFE